MAHRRSVRLTPEGHADKPAHLTSLGISYERRFEFYGDLVDHAMTVSYFRHAACHSTGPPSIRFRAALRWARLCSKMDVSSALQGYTVALDLLPQVAWLGTTIPARHRELAASGNIASEAAAAAISAEQYDTALELLEQGRSVVWGQLLQLRTPVDGLLEVQPTLADDLERISKAMEHASSHMAQTLMPFPHSWIRDFQWKKLCRDIGV